MPAAGILDPLPPAIVVPRTVGSSSRPDPLSDGPAPGQHPTGGPAR